MRLCGTRLFNPLRLALVISLLLHLLLIFGKFPASEPASGLQGNVDSTDTPDKLMRMARPPLQATFARPAVTPAVIPAVIPTPAIQAVPAPSPRTPAESPARAQKPMKSSTPAGVWSNRSWSKAERADMDNFLNDLASEARPPSGRELASRALATARQTGRSAPEEEIRETPGQPAANGRPVEPFSLEMYFNAFVKKLNRSAAFVKNDPRPRGARKALVELSLNPDGSLKSFRVIRSGDQEAEIAYIKSVIDRASPFSAFPPDIRNAYNSLSMLMCIVPPQAGGGGGFSRSFGAQDCKD